MSYEFPTKLNQEKSSVEISKEKIDKSEILARRVYEELERLSVPQALKKEILISLETPQLGPYHNEGPEMASHIGLILKSVDDIKNGTFDFGSLELDELYVEEIKAICKRAVDKNSENMGFYAFKHDLAKKDCMNIETPDKKQRIFTMGEWKELVTRNGGDKFKAQQDLISKGYSKIGYRIGAKLAKETGERERDHGDEAIAIIQRLSEEHPEVKKFAEERLGLILNAIINHEMHFQVFSQAVSAATYENFLVKKFSEEDIDFIFAVCAIDVFGSISSEGHYDLTGIKNMLVSRSLYKMMIDAPLGEENKKKLRNVKTIAEAQELISKLQISEKLQSFVVDDSVADNIIAKIGNWGVQNEDDQKILETAIRKSINQPNPLKVIEREITTKSLKIYVGNIKDEIINLI